MIKRLALIGVGLIGGSLVRALKKAKYCDHVVGCDVDVSALKRAQDLGVIDSYEQDPALAVGGADVVVIATPVGTVTNIFQRIAGHLAKDVLLTDVGSVKVAVVEAAGKVFGEVPSFFVPGHPIAGTEYSGVDASFAELFLRRRVILSPTSTTSQHALTRARELWLHTGADIMEMTAEHHDEVLAATSHLPHLLAYTLVDTLVQMDASEEIFRYAAGGFRDFTRIAASHPIMWRDICLTNRNAILQMITRYTEELFKLQKAIEAGDGEKITAVFCRAKAARDRLRVE